MEKSLFSVVQWPESQFYMEQSDKIHLIDSEHGYEEFGSSAYFVPIELQAKKSNISKDQLSPFYVPISFPESQLFMGLYNKKIHLILDEHGAKKYGNAAYFVPLETYQKVIEVFHSES